MIHFACYPTSAEWGYMQTIAFWARENVVVRVEYRHNSRWTSSWGHTRSHAQRAFCRCSPSPKYGCLPITCKMYPQLDIHYQFYSLVPFIDIRCGLCLCFHSTIALNGPNRYVYVFIMITLQNKFHFYQMTLQ